MTTQHKQNGKIGWKLIPANGGNYVALFVREGYRERDDGRILGPKGKLVRLPRGSRVQPIWSE